MSFLVEMVVGILRKELLYGLAEKKSECVLKYNPSRFFKYGIKVKNNGPGIVGGWLNLLNKMVSHYGFQPQEVKSVKSEADLIKAESDLRYWSFNELHGGGNTVMSGIEYDLYGLSLPELTEEMGKYLGGHDLNLGFVNYRHEPTEKIAIRMHVPYGPLYSERRVERDRLGLEKAVSEKFPLDKYGREFFHIEIWGPRYPGFGLDVREGEDTKHKDLSVNVESLIFFPEIPEIENNTDGLWLDHNLNLMGLGKFGIKDVARRSGKTIKEIQDIARARQIPVHKFSVDD